MKTLEYLKDKIIFVIITILTLIFTAFLLNSLGIGYYAIFFVTSINFIASILFYIVDFLKKKKYYNEILFNLNALDKKFLISEVIDKGNFPEGKLLYEILSITDKSMNDEVSKLKISSNEYKEYIETWVHEIKTPISVSKLIIENNESEITNSIDEELDKIENYIEQALFYARSNNLEKDYIINRLNLKSTINKVIKRNMNTLIEKNIKINLFDLDYEVYSDTKWLEFIINQLIINSIKYMDKNNKILKIYGTKNKNSISLNIEDNGIGIKKKDIIKVFEKGYTGTNGRIFGKSTGIGLYLCKTLSEKLGISINIKSKEFENTIVTLNFPINDMVTF
ncbi:sensor histidine kinase [Clostridium massiliamazoniense]|uniref:sensor histidine kinase n=1 Tax=Clostridium massiliamazoniense TaxID=1347366 RepID=UPI0006D7F9E5|nr:sensor histidine kinase [Clostridium massiliamazoniense]